MLASFRHKGLAELWNGGHTSRIDRRMHERILRRLDVLDATAHIEELAKAPGFNFHALKGLKPPRYTIHANGPWCITFEFEDGDAKRIDFEQYH